MFQNAYWESCCFRVSFCGFLGQRLHVCRWHGTSSGCVGILEAFLMKITKPGGLNQCLTRLGSCRHISHPLWPWFESAVVADSDVFRCNMNKAQNVSVTFVQPGYVSLTFSEIHISIKDFHPHHHLQWHWSLRRYTLDVENMLVLGAGLTALQPSGIGSPCSMVIKRPT